MNPDATPTLHHAEIFYIDTHNGWALVKYDEDRNQLGDAMYAFHKSDLKAHAKTLNVPTEVFTRNGEPLRTIRPNNGDDQ